MNAKVKRLNWKRLLNDSRKQLDCVAKRGVDTWTIKRTAMGHSTFYVLRLNGSVISRFEGVREAKVRAEQLCEEREMVR